MLRTNLLYWFIFFLPVFAVYDSAPQPAKIATTTAAPEPSPDDEPNINKASFKQVLQSWAGNQQKKFSNTTMLIKSEAARRHINCSASSLSIFVELRGQLLGIFEGKDAMSIADISTELIKISDVYRKKDDKGFDELFKKDKKDYKDIADNIFCKELDKLDLAAWLTEEVGKENANIKVSLEDFIRIYMYIFIRESEGIQAAKTNTIEIFDFIKLQKDMEDFVGAAYGAEFIGIANGVADCKTSAEVCIKLGSNFAAYADRDKLKQIYESNAVYKTMELQRDSIHVKLINMMKNNSN